MRDVKDSLENWHIRNYQAIVALPDVEYRKHENEFVIIHKGKIQAFFATFKEALAQALVLEFEPHAMSVQRVDRMPVHTGFVACDADTR